jgi:hypothetical protein
MPPDPYERLQAARTAVKALQDERSTLAVRLAELARGGDEDDIMAASMRLDMLPGELLRAELRLARADHQAAQATLRAAEASLAARVDLDDPEPDAAGGGRHPADRGARPKGSGRAAPPEGSADAQDGAPEDRPGTPEEGGAGADQATADADPGGGGGGGGTGAEPVAAADRPVAVAGARRVADEQWVRDCRSAAERAERRARELQTAVDRARDEPVDEAAHRGFAKRVVEARDAIERAREASNQAELDLIQATELARVALEGLAAARAGSDWRALEHARQARTTAAGAIGPAWEASRWAGLRVARAEYELIAWSRTASPAPLSPPGARTARCAGCRRHPRPGRRPAPGPRSPRRPGWCTGARSG